jgi:hypothetical protein
MMRILPWLLFYFTCHIIIIIIIRHAHTTPFITPLRHTYLLRHDAITMPLFDARHATRYYFHYHAITPRRHITTTFTCPLFIIYATPLFYAPCHAITPLRHYAITPFFATPYTPYAYYRAFILFATAMFITPFYHTPLRRMHSLFG